MKTSRLNILRYKGVPALKKCEPWLKNHYRKAVDFKCQECGQHEDKVGTLEAHRVIRKTHGGLYTVCPLNHKSSNIKVVCNKCHRKFHSKETGCH